MAVGEDRLVADTLVSQVARFSRDPIEGSQVVEAVTQALETIDAPDAVILMVGVDPALWELRNAPDFEWGSAVRRGSPPEPNGLFRRHAVYQVHEADKAFIVVADLQRAGVWHQYRPDVPEGALLLEDALLFEVEAFDAESAEALLAQAPDTYAYDEQRQARRTHEEQLDLVLQSVRLRILEKLRYEVREPDAGRVLEVKSEMER